MPESWTVNESWTVTDSLGTDHYIDVVIATFPSEDAANRYARSLNEDNHIRESLDAHRIIRTMPPT